MPHSFSGTLDSFRIGEDVVEVCSSIVEMDNLNADIEVWMKKRRFVIVRFTIECSIQTYTVLQRSSTKPFDIR